MRGRAGGWGRVAQLAVDAAADLAFKCQQRACGQPSSVDEASKAITKCGKPLIGKNLYTCPSTRPRCRGRRVFPALRVVFGVIRPDFVVSAAQGASGARKRELIIVGGSGALWPVDNSYVSIIGVALYRSTVPFLLRFGVK